MSDCDQRNKSRTDFIKKSILNDDSSNLINTLPDNFVVASLLGTSSYHISSVDGNENHKDKKVSNDKHKSSLSLENAKCFSHGKNIHGSNHSMRRSGRIRKKATINKKQRNRNGSMLQSSDYDNHFGDDDDDDQSMSSDTREFQFDCIDDNDDDENAGDEESLEHFQIKDGNEFFASKRDIIMKKNNYIVVDYNPTSAQLEAMYTIGENPGVSGGFKYHENKKTQRAYNDQEGDEECMNVDYNNQAGSSIVFPEFKDKIACKKSHNHSAICSTKSYLDFRNVPIMNQRELDVQLEKNEETGQMEYKSKRRRVKHGDIVKCSELNIKLRIMEQCIHPTVKEIINQRKQLNDPEMQKKIKEIQEARLNMIVDDIVSSAMS